MINEILPRAFLKSASMFENLVEHETCFSSYWTLTKRLTEINIEHGILQMMIFFFFLINQLIVCIEREKNIQPNKIKILRTKAYLPMLLINFSWGNFTRKLRYLISTKKKTKKTQWKKLPVNI